MLEKITDEIKKILGEGLEIYFDENKFNNFLSQNQRDKKVCFIEEYRNGSYNNSDYGFSRTDSISLYVYNSGNGKPLNATQREEVRSNLEEEIVIPLIKYYADRISNIRFSIGVSRYSSIETGITITFNLNTEICYD